MIFKEIDFLCKKNKYFYISEVVSNHWSKWFRGFRRLVVFSQSWKWNLGPSSASRPLTMCTLVGFHQNSGLRFTYGNDPEIFSISIMEKVLEIRNSGTISGPIFSVNRKFPARCSGIPEYRSRNFLEKSFWKFPELH